MIDCQCKSGFFSLRDCGQPSLAVCSECQRAMCHEHSAAESTFTQCRDCWARAHQLSDADARRQRDRDYDDNWAYSYRDRYYATSYQPVYTGTHYHHYYDRYDTRSFHDRDGEVDDGSDNARAGFGDS
jgi:hypothetical protein